MFVSLSTFHAFPELLDTPEEKMRERRVGYLVGTLKSLTVLNTGYAISSSWAGRIFGHQGPEHEHINNIKRLAGCVNNKKVYL